MKSIVNTSNKKQLVLYLEVIKWTLTNISIFYDWMWIKQMSHHLKNKLCFFFLLLLYYRSSAPPGGRAAEQTPVDERSARSVVIINNTKHCKTFHGKAKLLLDKKTAKITCVSWQLFE